MLRHVPNAITASRLLLAIVFFSVLSLYQYEGRGYPTLLGWGLVIYLVALLTDFLDGYLARRWKVEGAFGRVVDPFVDKVLVLGSFTFFAGKNFIIPGSDAGDTSNPMVVRTITGVAPGMVVILLARELLVTTLRGMSEASGQAFGARFSGKFKMVAQSVTIIVILVYVDGINIWKHYGVTQWAESIRDVCIWATIAITLLSGLMYVRRAVQLYKQGR